MFSKYTRFDATHTRSISVQLQDFQYNRVADEVTWLGLRVFTSSELLADICDVETQPIEALHKAYREAIDAGDHVFFMQMGKHSDYSFRFCLTRPRRDWDSGWVGIVIVPREAWLHAYPHKTFAKQFVFRELKKLAERIKAQMNGEIYEAIVCSEDESVSYPDCLSPQEALAYAQTDYPEIRYTEDDFEVATTYRLVANA